MYHDYVVDVPKAPGKLVFMKRNETVYVYYQLERVYYADKGFNSAKRAMIGKLVDANDRTKMYPNPNYDKIFCPRPKPEATPSADEVVEAEETHEPTNPPMPLPPAVKRSNTLSIGTFIVIEKIIKENSLDEGLALACPDYFGLLLDLATYMIVEQSNVAQHFHAYARNHPLLNPKMRIYSDSTISWLYHNLPRDTSTDFLNWWNARMDHNQRIYISYDSTNKSCQAGDLNLAEPGKGKDNKKLPIVNVSIAHNQTLEVPLFYEIYPGSVNDVSQLQYLLKKLIEYNYKSLGFVLDRGYFSRANIDFMDANEIAFLMMVKGCKPLVSQLVDEHIGTFETNRSCHIRGTGLYGVTVERALYEGDTKTRYFHLCYSPEKMLKERCALEDTLALMAAEMERCKNSNWIAPEAYEQFFECQYHGEGDDRVFLFAKEKTDAISRALARCGFFCLITSEKMTAEEAYLMYSGRDSTEKLFRADKTFLGSRSERVNSDNAFRAKIFNEFLALIVRSRFYTLLKAGFRKLKVKRNYLTVPAAISELEKIEITRCNDERYVMSYALTRRQKEILALFGISEQDFLARAEQLSMQLLAIPDELAEPKAEGEEEAQEELDIYALNELDLEGIDFDVEDIGGIEPDAEDSGSVEPNAEGTDSVGPDAEDSGGVEPLV